RGGSARALRSLSDGRPGRGGGTRPRRARAVRGAPARRDPGRRRVSLERPGPRGDPRVHPSARARGGPVSGRRILLVDDDPALRALVRMTLPTDGTEVVEAAGADEAVTLLDGSPFDLVLLDWTMPEKSGADVLRTLHDRG